MRNRHTADLPLSHAVSLRYRLFVDAEMRVGVAIAQGEVEADHVDKREIQPQTNACSGDDTLRKIA